VAATHINALGQFRLHSVFGQAGASVGFSQSNLMMVIAAVVIVFALVWGMRKRARVPGRAQALAEMSYESVLQMCTDTMGPEGRRFFPFIFTLFAFILLGNLIGEWPYAFTFTSHIAVTGFMALFVVVMTTIVGLAFHGLRFFSYFFPPGAPVALAPLLVPIEIMSYLSRLISLSVRLFANMVAGHVMLEVFAAFVLTLGAAGILGWVPAAFALAVSVALIAFEFLVAAIQAYVFAILTCIYLHDAIHLH
jgi:F-type H+-transporting ATPase subunit a